MSKTFSMNTLSGYMSADELETLRWTHETVLVFNYDQEELNMDESGFVHEELQAMGLEVVCTSAPRSTFRALKVSIPYGGKLVD